MTLNNILKKLYSVMFAFILAIDSIWSQQWVWSEIAEESDGNFFDGLGVILVLCGIIWICSKIFGGNDDEESSSTYDDKLPDCGPTISIDDFNPIEEQRYNEQNEEYAQDFRVTQSDVSQSVSDPMTAFNKEYPSMSIKESFETKCVKIYGDYSTVTYDLVLIKEDGKYRQISNSDPRYNVLVNYIYKYKRERYGSVGLIGSGSILEYYIRRLKSGQIFPEAKPMESHGKLEKEYYGEQVAMLMAYYDPLTTRYYCGNEATLLDFCLALGWEQSIYLHKVICQPMDREVYYELKNMMLRNMTYEEYKLYRPKAGVIIERSEGYYDGWYNKIGDTWSEADAEMQRRQVITYEQAFKEVTQIEWHL